MSEIQDIGDFSLGYDVAGICNFDFECSMCFSRQLCFSRGQEQRLGDVRTAAVFSSSQVVKLLAWRAMHRCVDSLKESARVKVVDLQRLYYTESIHKKLTSSVVRAHSVSSNRLQRKL